MSNSNDAPNIALKVAYRLGRKAGVLAAIGAKHNLFVALAEHWPTAKERLPALTTHGESAAAYTIGFYDGYTRGY